jgi:hypothetical protein
MQQPMTPTTDDYIAAAMSAFRARRGEKTIHAGGRSMRVHTPGERVIHLPNGHQVKVSVDDSGIATQIKEDEALHAIVRPKTIRRKLVAWDPDTSVAMRARPIPIRTTAIPRIGGVRVPR